MTALSTAALSQESSFQRLTSSDARPFSQSSLSHFHGVSNQRVQDDFRQSATDSERTRLPRPQIRRPTEKHFTSNDDFQFATHQHSLFPAPAVQQPAVHGQQAVASNFPSQQQQQPVFQNRPAAVPQHQQGQTGSFAPQQTLKPVSVEQLTAHITQKLHHQRPVSRPVNHPQLTAVQDNSFPQSFQQPSTTQFRQQQATTADTAVRHNLGFSHEPNSQIRGSTHGSAAEDEQQTQHRPAGKRPSDELAEDELIRKKQAENAKYSFQTSVTDTINDHQIIRQEMRDGLKLTGAYSYSDGFYKRTVFYEADENGYRVVK